MEAKRDKFPCSYNEAIERHVSKVEMIIMKKKEWSNKSELARSGMEQMDKKRRSKYKTHRNEYVIICREEERYNM